MSTLDELLAEAEGRLEASAGVVVSAAHDVPATSQVVQRCVCVCIFWAVVMGNNIAVEA